MPRALPAGALAAMMAPETSEAFIYLLTITPDSGALYYTNNSVDVTSNGQLYEQLPFDIILAPHEEGTVTQATLTIDNVERRLIDDIRAHLNPIPVSIDIVSSRDFHETVASFQDTVMRNVNYDQVSISGSLVVENLFVENFSQLMTGRFYPALFVAR